MPSEGGTRSGSAERARSLLGHLGPHEDARVWRAPGRVNLIGEHIDYLGGRVLPFACDREVLLAAAPLPGRVRLTSLEASDPVDLDLSAPGEPKGWGRYVGGVLAALREAQVRLQGFEGVLSSTVPVGAGLSSSAAVEAAVALAFTAGEPPAPEVLQRAEHLAVGVPCGIMDQVAVLEGRAEHALLLDCGTGLWDPIPIPAGLAFVIVDTGSRRALADGRYAVRQRQAEEAFREAERLLGVRGIGELGPDAVTDLAGRLGEREQRRLRHVAGEHRRVDACAEALREGDLAAVGRLVDASHVSLRDDFEVSSDGLEVGRDTVRAHPACLGARLVGAGFAGCVLACVETGAEADVVSWVGERLAPVLVGAEAFGVRAVNGAGELPLTH